MRRVCGDCGGSIVEANLRGDVFSWRDYLDIPLSVDFIGRKCSNCGDVVLNGVETRQLDEILETAVRQKTVEFIENIKTTKDVTQREIARKIGISAEYLSELMSKRRTASLVIYNLVKLLSLMPNLFHSLECFDGKFVAGFVGGSNEKFKHLRSEQRERIDAASRFKALEL